jgi:hypothetical protein
MIDADGVVVGQLACQWRCGCGKHADLHPCRLRRQHHHHQCRQAVLTGRKRDKDLLPPHRHRRHRGAPEIDPDKHPERVVEKAIERMLPRGPLARRQLERGFIRVLSIRTRRRTHQVLALARSIARTPGRMMADHAIARPAWRAQAGSDRDPEIRSEDRQAGPLRHRQARTRWRGCGSIGAGKIEINTAWSGLFRAAGAAHADQQPLVATNRNGQYDIICTVSGGGLGPGAVRNISRHSRLRA